MRRALSFTLALAGMWSAASTAALRADPISTVPTWSYSTAGTPSMTQTGASGPSIVLSGEHGISTGSQNVVAANLYTYSNSPSLTQITPTHVRETIFLRDIGSGQTGSLTFDATLSGAVTSTGSWLALVPFGATTQVLHLGHYFYTVTVDPFRAPENPSTFGGSLVFDVKVHHNPEPSSLVLAGLGMSLVGLRRWRKRLAASSL
jgi:hypothetical protein